MWGQMTEIWDVSMVEFVDAKVQMTKGSSKPHHETPNYPCPLSSPSAQLIQNEYPRCCLSLVLDGGLRWLLFTSDFPYSVLSLLTLHKAMASQGCGARRSWEDLLVA